MKISRRPASSAFIACLVACIVACPCVASAQQAGSASAYDQAVQNWTRGNYPAAIQRLITVMSAPDGDAYLERTALLTGELYRTTELTIDGRTPRWGSTGKFASYEVGSGAGRVTRIVAMTGGPRTIAEVHGSNFAFAAGDERAAYISIRETPELEKARQDLDRATKEADRAAQMQAQAEIARLEAENSSVVVRDLATQHDRVIADGGLRKVALAWSSDGKSLYAVGAPTGETKKTDIYALNLEGGAPSTLTSDDSVKADVVIVPGGRYLLFAAGGRNPLARGGAGGRGGGGGAAGRSGTFGVLDLESHATQYVSGTSPAVAANGSAVAFLGKSNGEFAISVLALPATAAPVIVRQSADSLAAPALSPSGQLIAYQMMPEHDWEIYTIGRDGKTETRVTREIQHDVLPKFLDESCIIAMQGEPRHRRSFLYDLSAHTRTRLFDNNTVRTIAPEYEWVPSLDGEHLLIVAERDGDTVSPERGVYMMELKQKVTKADVLDRLKHNLAIEQKLRANGLASYKSMAPQVQNITSQISTDRIYSYEKALFDFDSKHVTKPGNAKARQYLFDTYQSFGYAPVMQEFDTRATAQQPSAHTANVYVTIKGTINPELIYVVGSHFDSRAEGPGADDDASGTAALLEAARVLAKHPMPATVVLVSFTGEEAGLLGSREFVRQAGVNKWHIVGALNNDMIGWANDDRMDNTIRYSNPGIRDIQHAAAMQFSNLITYDALYYKSTDAAAFYDGWGDIIGGIGSYPVLGNPHYHMPHDNLEYENHQLIAEVSKTTTATIMLLASSPSRLTGLTVAAFDGKSAELTWTASPEKDTKKYVVAWGPDVAASSMSPAALASTAAHSIVVTEPHAKITGIAPGTTVAVKAINARGLEGWDWARIVVGQTKAGAASER
ncbi:MAG: M20/M25/M40 family metallo-hydrolase [bacterium]